MQCFLICQEMSHKSMCLALQHSYEQNDAAALFYRWANWGSEGILPAQGRTAQKQWTRTEARSFSRQILPSPCTRSLEHFINFRVLALGIFILLFQTQAFSPWEFYTKPVRNLWFVLPLVSNGKVLLYFSAGLLFRRPVQRAALTHPHNRQPAAGRGGRKMLGTD